MIVPVKTCTGCKVEKPLSEFYRRGAGLSSWCKSCHGVQRREWRKNNPERTRELGRKNQYDRLTRLRGEVIEAYGGSCICCGEIDPHFLTVEHKTPEARQRHKTKDGRNMPSAQMLSRIKAEGFPDDVTIMCANCNYSHGHYGFCPHSGFWGGDERYPYGVSE